jgi:hypothetical protein
MRPRLILALVAVVGFALALYAYVQIDEPPPPESGYGVDPPDG